MGLILFGFFFLERMFLPIEYTEQVVKAKKVAIARL